MTKILLYSDFKPGVSEVVDDALLSLLAGTRCRIGYIPSDSDTKRRYFDKVVNQYAKIGLHDLFYFDLGEEFAADQIPALMKCDAIHLSGGDPVRFMELIRQRQFGEHLKRYLDAGGIVIGVSAGAMVLGKTLGLMDMIETKSKTKVVRGLKHVDFEFYPHFKADERTLKQLQQYAVAQKTTVYACDDDAGILVRDGRVELLGRAQAFVIV